MKQAAHILHIESMRAIAAMMVLLFHFISYNNAANFLVDNEEVRHWSEFGAQGVEMFYIISGYVMMLSLTRKNYKWPSYGRYVLKRVLRIIPLYWTVLFVMLGFLYYMWRIVPDTKTLLANMFFIVDLFEDTEWYNLVFSTLGVEVQFYLLLGLMFPLFRLHPIMKYVVFAAWLCGGYMTLDNYTVLLCSPFFIIGILLHDLESKFQWADVALIAFLIGAMFWFTWYDDVAIIIITLVLFFVLKPTWKPLTKLGSFSYSIYLTHGLFGGWLLFFATAEAYGNTVSPWLILPAILISLVGAYVFYWFVEKPSIRWSKSVKMVRKEEER